MDTLPKDLPIVMASFDFSSDIPAAEYVIKSKQRELAPGQVTVHPSASGYENVLNEAGKELLEQTLERMKLPDEICAVLKGSTRPSRTGVLQHADGSMSLCSWNNYVFIGDVLEKSKKAKPRIIVGKNIQTSPIVFYKIDNDGRGWILTESGTIYHVQT